MKAEADRFAANVLPIIQKLRGRVHRPCALSQMF